MAQTHVDVKSRTRAEMPAARTNGTPAAVDSVTSQAAKKAYELTDEQGNRAYVWWTSDVPTVEANDPTLRRRVVRALKKPIWSREHELDEFSMNSDRLVLIQPDDPRYANRLLWQWDQLGIRGLVSVDVVTLPDKLSVRRFSPLHRAVAQRLGIPDTAMSSSASTDRA